MHRFFVDHHLTGTDRIALRGETAHQIARVLRLGAGQRIVLADGGGDELVAELQHVTPREVTAVLLERRPGRPEPLCSVTLYQAVLRPARFEWLLEKATELGVARFVPVLTARSVVRAEGAVRLDRWRRIVREAAEQSGRTVLPEIGAPVPLDEAVYEAGGLRVVCWEAEERYSLRSVLREEAGLQRLNAVSLFIGPEGGLTEEEVRGAERAGARIASLGRRILRSETAGLIAAAAVLYELGDLGG